MSRKKPVKKTNSQPSLTGAISTVDGRAESIQKEIGELNVELKKCGGQMKGMRDGPSKDMVKRKAKRILSKKREYERLLERSRTQSFNLEQASYAMQNVRDTRTTVDALNSGRKALKKEFKKVSISEIEETMDEAAALMEQSNEIQQILGRSYSLHNHDYSKEDLEAELDAFLEDEDTSYLDITVNASEPNSFVPGTPQHLMDVQNGQPNMQDNPEIGANGNPSSSDRRNNEPGIGVVPVPVPIPVPVVPPLVIPAVVPPVPPVPLPKFSSKKSGDKPSRKEKNKEKKKKRKKDKKKNRKEDKNDKDKKKRKKEQDERDAERHDRDKNKDKCDEDEDHCDKEDDRDHDRPDPPEHSSDSSSDSEEEEKVKKKKESLWKKVKRTFLKRRASSKSHAVLQRQKDHFESEDYGPFTARKEHSRYTLNSSPTECNSEMNTQNYPPPTHSDHHHEMDSWADSSHRGSQHGKTSSPPTRPPPYHTTKSQDHKPPLHRSYTAPSSSSRPQHSESPSTPVHPLPPRTKSLDSDPSFWPRRTAPPPPGSVSSSHSSRPKRSAPPPPGSKPHRKDPHCEYTQGYFPEQQDIPEED